MSDRCELALFSVLFTDGMWVGWSDLRSAWRLPGRALLLGLPLTLVITAAFAHWVAGLSWIESLLIGAVLAPTDPVFAAALVGNDKVPARLRHLLNVESGVNDGLALPFVLIFLTMASGSPDLHLGALAGELAVGLLIGIVVPYAAIRLEATRFFSASARYQPLNALAIGLLVLGLAQATHGNLYLAAFAAGITIATCGPRQREAFEEFGELLAELLKLAALLVFGALISPAFLGGSPWADGSSRSWRWSSPGPRRWPCRSWDPDSTPGNRSPRPGSARRASPPSSTGCSCWTPRSPPRTRCSTWSRSPSCCPSWRIPPPTCWSPAGSTNPTKPPAGTRQTRRHEPHRPGRPDR